MDNNPSLSNKFNNLVTPLIYYTLIIITYQNKINHILLIKKRLETSNNLVLSSCLVFLLLYNLQINKEATTRFAKQIVPAGKVIDVFFHASRLNTKVWLSLRTRKEACFVMSSAHISERFDRKGL